MDLNYVKERGQVFRRLTTVTSSLPAAPVSFVKKAQSQKTISRKGSVGK